MLAFMGVWRSLHIPLTYKGCLVVVELLVFEYKPSSSPVLGSEARPSKLAHPALVGVVLELEAWHHQSWVGFLAVGLRAV